MRARSSIGSLLLLGLAAALFAACVTDAPDAPDEAIVSELSSVHRSTGGSPSPSFPAEPGNSALRASRHADRSRVLVASSRDGIRAYATTSGASLGELIPAGRGGLDEPDSMVIGPDGKLYVTSGAEPETSAVLRFDVRTGAFLGVFASGHGLHRPYGLAFGRDGLLYVSSFKSDEILRFDGCTGAFVDVFATGDGQPGGLNGPNALLFGPDGGLYVSTEGSIAGEFPGLPSEVLRYDIRTRAHRVFVAQPEPAPSSLGFVSLLGLAFGPDCHRGRRHCDLFVSDFANDVRRHDATTGALERQLDTNYTGTLPSGNFTGGIAFDRNGRLFVAGFDREAEGNPGALLRFDGFTGRPQPAHGSAGALLVSPTPTLVRPIGVLVVE